MESVKQVVSYTSHTVTQNGVVKLTFKAKFDQIEGSKKLLDMLTMNIVVKARKPGANKINDIGVFKIAGISFNSGGISTIKFTSLETAVNLNEINDLITMDEFQIKYSTLVD